MIKLDLLFLSAAFAFSVLLSGCSNSGPTQALPNSVMSFERFSEMRAFTPLEATAGECDKLCQDRRNEFAYVVYVGKQIYCYWDLKKADTGTDFDKLAAALQASITSATTPSDYFKILRQWASAFHDGHVNALLKDNLTELDWYTAPIRLEVLAPATDHEKLIVSNVSDSTTGIAVGDEVIELNGTSAKDSLTQAAAVSSSGSTERMRRYGAARRLVDVLGIENGSRSLQLTLRPFAGGVEKKVELYFTAEIDLKPTNSHEPEDTGLSYFTARVLPHSIGYFRIDSFEGTQDDFIISQTMDRLAQTRGLILDLRQNGGGDLSGNRILERLTDKVLTRYKQSERKSDFVLAQYPEIFPSLQTSDATGLFAAWHDLTVNPTVANHYAKPVVALIGPLCFSACDTFSAALKATHLATFVGEPTGGGTGTPIEFDLPISPYKFRYSVTRGQTASGEWIEGAGTSPEIYIEPTSGDRAQQRDGQLEKTISVLESQISNGLTQGIAPVDLAGVPKIWEQRMDRSPTRVDNDFLVRIGNHDER